MTRPWLGSILLIALGTAGYLLARQTGLLDVLQDPVARERGLLILRGAADRAWVGPAFSAGYAAAVAVGLPASVLTLLGGAAFGTVRGILWVSLGANAGATAGFWIARRLGRSALEALVGSRLGAFDRLSLAAGFSGVLTLRLLPVVPFSVFNFVCGLTPIRWAHFALATLVGILPGTVVYVLSADALLTGAAGTSRDARIRALAAGLLLMAFIMSTRWLLRRRARHAS